MSLRRGRLGGSRSSTRSKLASAISSLVNSARDAMRTILTALLICGLLAPTHVYAKAKRQKAEEVQSGDSIKQEYTKADGEICYRQVIMVTGKGRPTAGWAESSAKALWRSTVKGIHGERFIDIARAKDLQVVELPASLGTTRYVVKGRPCAVSF